MRTLLLSATFSPNLSINEIFLGCLIAGFTFSLLLFVASGRLRVPIRWKTRLSRASSRRLNSPTVIHLAVGSGLVGFGIGGLISSEMLGFDPAMSCIAASIAAVVVASTFVAILHRLYDGSGQQIQGSPVLGAVARVSLSIPVGGTGSIAYTSDGKRHTMPARSLMGLPLDLGDRVIVVGLKGAVAEVEAF